MLTVRKACRGVDIALPRGAKARGCNGLGGASSGALLRLDHVAGALDEPLGKEDGNRPCEAECHHEKHQERHQSECRKSGWIWHN